MPTKRTKYRIIALLRELENYYQIKKDELPDNMELMPDEIHVGIYLTEEEFLQRQGEIFPTCPLTGAFCNWDSDYNAIGDLF